MLSPRGPGPLAHSTTGQSMMQNTVHPRAKCGFKTFRIAKAPGACRAGSATAQRRPCQEPARSRARGTSRRRCQNRVKHHAQQPPESVAGPGTRHAKCRSLVAPENRTSPPSRVPPVPAAERVLALMWLTRQQPCLRRRCKACCLKIFLRGPYLVIPPTS